MEADGNGIIDVSEFFSMTTGGGGIKDADSKEGIHEIFLVFDKER